jgi:Cu(I)/Ag(I) efflux system membrane protein CusA/SilA
MSPAEPQGARPEGLVGRAVAGLIAASAAQPWLTALLVAALALLGAQALRRTPLDAIPDLSEPQVVIFTDWPGRSPQLVEDQVTYPLSAALLGSAGVVAVRGQSMFGMSFVTVIFDEHTDLGRARSAALERLFRLELPEGARAELGPEASGVGWVFQYARVDRTGQLGLH